MLTKLNQDLRVFRTPSPSVSEVVLGKINCKNCIDITLYHRMMTVIIFMDSNIQI